MDPNVPTFNPDGGGYYDPNDQGDYVGYVGGYDHGASQQYANYDSHDATAVGAGGDNGDECCNEARSETKKCKEKNANCNEY